MFGRMPVQGPRRGTDSDHRRNSEDRRPDTQSKESEPLLKHLAPVRRARVPDLLFVGALLFPMACAGPGPPDQSNREPKTVTIGSPGCSGSCTFDASHTTCTLDTSQCSQVTVAPDTTIVDPSAGPERARRRVHVREHYCGEYVRVRIGRRAVRGVLVADHVRGPGNRRAQFPGAGDVGREHRPDAGELHLDGSASLNETRRGVHATDASPTAITGTATVTRNVGTAGRPRSMPSSSARPAPCRSAVGCCCDRRGGRLGNRRSVRGA
jgi:hypothetical protein